jgi:hypothetical protein
MNMKLKLRRIIGALVIIVPFLMLLLPSCSQKNQDCIAIVHVVDTGQNPVVGATVLLHKTNITNYNGVTANVSQTGTSDGGGAVTMTFSLPAVLDVNVTKGAKQGAGQIRLEAAQTVTQTITIQ